MSSGPDAYAEIEYAGACVSATAIFPPPPGSTVEDLDTSAGRLGCGVPSVFITSRCSGSMTCQIDLSDITKLTWTRRLSEVSEAEVEIGLSGDSSQTCCQCLAIVEPFCHELHIWRDGEEAWVGPIEAIRYERELVTIKAKDSLNWLDVRIPNQDIEFKTGGLSGPTSDITDIAEFVIRDAFEEDVAIGHSCEVDNLYMVATGELIDWFSEGFNQTALEILTDIAETELDFTTLGRTIILTGDSASLTPLILLYDEHIMGEIEVTKDGKLLVNRQYVHYEGDAGIPAIGAKDEAERYCYGLIERVMDGNGLQVLQDAEVTAQSIVDTAYIAPRVIEIPPGSKLSPDTPWTINQMVPGARVDVAVTRLCLELTQSFLLVGVSVEYSANEGESVGIELSPMNSVAA